MEDQAVEAVAGALRESGYTAFRERRLVFVRHEELSVPALLEFVHGQFRALALEPRFPCAGARSAMNKGTYRFALYRELGDAGSTEALCRDLRAYVAEPPVAGEPADTFVACFAGPTGTADAEFRALVKRQMDALLARDESPWDPTVSSDPADAHYAFSFAGRAFTIVGLHAGSPRWARRFAWPTMVFNAERLFHNLYYQGKLLHFRQVVRVRDAALQGTANPDIVRKAVAE